MGIRSVLRRNFAANATWLITVLCGIVAWLLITTQKGDVIAAYVGFASSVASLLLALVAIGYAYVSNQSFSETIGTLRSSALSLERTAANVEVSSADLAKHYETIQSEVARVPVAVKELTSKFNERLALEGQVGGVVDEPKLDLTRTALQEDPAPSSLRVGTWVSLYLLAKSQELSTSFLPTKIFAGKPEVKAWGSILTGSVSAIADLNAYGIKVSYEKVGTDTYYRCDDLGRYAKGEIEKNARGNEPTAKVIEIIDEYFGLRNSS